MTEYHDRASGPPRAHFDRVLGQPETELQKAAREVLTDLGYFWLGDLSGWEVAGGAAGQVELHHRCGYAETLPASGVQADFSVYVGNLVERVLEVSQGHACAPHEPSPEHRARIARWSAAAGLTPTGDVAQDQLALVRAMVSKGPRNRPVDGPGCTPAVVPGALEAIRDVVCQTPSTGHGPEDYPEEPAEKGLYAGKCEECTTGVSCEDARRCLFEG